jgi:hypothetical protein
MTQTTWQLVGEINGGPISGTRNRIINGGMAVDQRNSGASISSGINLLTYTLDRWIVGASGAAVTAARNGTPGVNYLALTGAAGNTAVSIRQRIEAANIADLSSKSVTLSFACNASILISVGINVSCASALDNFTTVTDTQAFTKTISPTGTIYSVTFTLPSQASNGVEILFALTNLTSGTFGLTNVQLEPGSVATPFEQRSYGAELTLCQRYYENVTNYWVGNTTSTAVYYSFSSYKIDKRTVPIATSLAQSGAGNGGFGSRTAGTPLTSGFFASGTAASTVNAGGWNDSWAISAEL